MLGGFRGTSGYWLGRSSGGYKEIFGCALECFGVLRSLWIWIGIGIERRVCYGICLGVICGDGWK